MDDQKLKGCIEICKDAFRELEGAKSDCKAIVDAAIDSFFSIPEDATKELRKEILSTEKEMTKAIKKAAKALLKEEGKEALVEENDTMSSILDVIRQ